MCARMFLNANVIVVGVCHVSAFGIRNLKIPMTAELKQNEADSLASGTFAFCPLGVPSPSSDHCLFPRKTRAFHLRVVRSYGQEKKWILPGFPPPSPQSDQRSPRTAAHGLADLSKGRSASGSDDWYFMARPTGWFMSMHHRAFIQFPLAWGANLWY